MAIVVLSFASTTILWLWLLAFLSLLMLQSCLADDQLKLHRLSSRKLCPSCNTRFELYPLIRDSLAAQESISDQTGHRVWIPIRVSVSAAAVMMLLGSVLWHTSRGNALFDEQENDQEADIRGSRESRTGNDCTDNTSEGDNQVECLDSSLCRLDVISKMTIRMILPKVKTRCNIQTCLCVSGGNKMDNQVDTQDVPSFSLNAIRKATEYFSGKNMIGQGGFGVVSGYMSPEYAMCGQISVKVDVFSFGVLILEIITGKKNNHSYQIDGVGDLLSYVWQHWRDGTPMELLNSNLTDSYSRDEVMRCIHLGLLCVQEDPAARPTMATVVLMLNSYSVTPPLPQQPAFYMGKDSDKSTCKSMLCSVDNASITELHPR